MWLPLVFLAALTEALALPPHVAFPSKQACEQWLADRPAAIAAARRHGGRIECVEFKVAEERGA